MAGRTIVITGASDGVGAAAAKRLTRSGENVVVVGRSPQKTAAVAQPLGADSFVADFADLAQVRELARRLLETYPRIDVLANNAGGMMNTRETTVDGFEKTFQVNHLAPMLLTTLLLDRLVESGASVLNTSSMANKFARVGFDDLDAVQNQNGSLAYGTSKLANILFTKELHRRYHGAGISTAAFHPGPVASNFSAEVDNPLFGVLYRSPLRHVALIGTEQGSDELVWLASAEPGVDWQSGEYYYKHKVARANKIADDARAAERLWDGSLELLGAKAMS
ncbi:SDR family NAD(P)-dependent oxidoreductase [Mycolicibacterium litorale]|uniref:Retinol dehydrogenase n=1 Tax=Mycolicibacterium litorale TaxID=758802 RepID=A0AAD1ISN9_9MYCO|nr:SDR family NAD(P)-dependent oxidoreductase [Mycolicibacterium litorale]MCV7417591.1 SDR family NAD(P)-dependent oxidoreductase [Mycolicibacterium litorale]TDX99889.1 short-subunit dehydrogenase [Mycolicibacterium litorale]BBY18817.1 retinol dehydrogenase [Mycolicibacterium litorale]